MLYLFEFINESWYHAMETRFSAIAATAEEAKAKLVNTGGVEPKDKLACISVIALEALAVKPTLVYSQGMPKES